MFVYIVIIDSLICSIGHFLSLVTKVDLQDREFLTALAQHAQALAKIILKRSDSGYHLAEDAQVTN